MSYFHFLPPTILWPEPPAKLEDVLPLVTFSLASVLPKTFRSSNSLYDGMNGLCAVEGVEFLGPPAVHVSAPRMATGSLIPLTGNELRCCNGLETLLC